MKMLKNLLITVVCVAFAMSAACSSDSDNRGNPAANHVVWDIGEGPGESADTGGLKDVDSTDFEAVEKFLEDMETALAAIICDNVFSCEDKNSPGWVSIWGRTGDKQTCVRDHKNIFKYHDREVPTAKILASVAAGRTKFDAVKAAACLDELSGRLDPCREDDEHARCMDEAFVATLAVGSVCAADTECIGGFCTTRDVNTCPGTCTAYLPDAAAGERCEVAKCGSGLTCTWNSDSTQTCKVERYAGLGGACDHDEVRCEEGLGCGVRNVCVTLVYLEKDAACDEETYCKPGLTCIGEFVDDSTLVGTCQPIRQEGEICLYTDQCAMGLACTESSGFKEGICVALRKTGEECVLGGHESELCDDESACTYDYETETGICVTYDDSVCEIS